MTRGTLQQSQPRWDEIIRSSRSARRPRRTGGGRRAITYIALLAAIVVLLAGGIYVYLELKLRANREVIKELTSRTPDQPVNVLLVGSDDRSVLPDEELDRFDPTGADRRTGRRSDTIMLAHLDEKREQAVILSFPRDLRVKYPNGTVGKINGVYQRGAGALVDTVESFSGLPVHHYVEVNFVGFRNIVDSLGGVEVFFERKISEPDSGLNVPAGCVELKGDQALAFVRIRKIDDDFGRIARQQLFISLMMDRVTSAGTLLNPFKLIPLINLFAENLSTDANLSVNDARKIAWRLRSFNPQRVDMRVIPSSTANIGGISYVIHNQRQTQALLAAVSERKPLPDYGRTGVSAIDPSDVRFQSLNGTTVDGLASRGEEDLKSRGFTAVSAPADADRNNYAKTTVYYREGHEDKARLVASAYAADVKPLPRNLLTQADVAVVFGADFAEGKATPAAAPVPGKSKPAPKPLIHRC